MSFPSSISKQNGEKSKPPRLAGDPARTTLFLELPPMAYSRILRLCTCPKMHTNYSHFVAGAQTSVAPLEGPVALVLEELWLVPFHPLAAILTSLLAASGSVTSCVMVG